ncbi:class I lanthipeptide [Spirosoma areae]
MKKKVAKITLKTDKIISLSKSQSQSVEGGMLLSYHCSRNIC